MMNCIDNLNDDCNNIIIENSDGLIIVYNFLIFNCRSEFKRLFLLTIVQYSNTPIMHDNRILYNMNIFMAYYFIFLYYYY